MQGIVKLRLDEGISSIRETCKKKKLRSFDLRCLEKMTF